MLYPSRERGKKREGRGSRGGAGLAEDVYQGYDIARLLVSIDKELLKDEVHRIANKTLK